MMDSKDHCPTAPPHVRKLRWETLRPAEGLICVIDLLGKPPEIGSMGGTDTYRVTKRDWIEPG